MEFIIIGITAVGILLILGLAFFYKGKDGNNSDAPRGGAYSKEARTRAKAAPSGTGTALNSSGRSGNAHRSSNSDDSTAAATGAGIFDSQSNWDAAWGDTPSSHSSDHHFSGDYFSGGSGDFSGHSSSYHDSSSSASSYDSGSSSSYDSGSNYSSDSSSSSSDSGSSGGDSGGGGGD